MLDQEILPLGLTFDDVLGYPIKDVDPAVVKKGRLREDPAGLSRADRTLG